MQTLQSILAPVDGSRASGAALDHAVALAQDYGAEVIALHVVASDDPLTAQARLERDRELEAYVEHAEMLLGNRLVRRRVYGDPVREIVELARGCDLVVMGTHGRIGRVHSILGSVAEGVVRNAPCPVLTVRDPTGGYQSFAERRHRRPLVGDTPGPTAGEPSRHARGR